LQQLARQRELLGDVLKRDPRRFLLVSRRGQLGARLVLKTAIAKQTALAPAVAVVEDANDVVRIPGHRDRAVCIHAAP
jgi:hypothetical protein